MRRDTADRKLDCAGSGDRLTRDGGERTGREHDDGAGNGVPGQWPTGRGHTGGELASIYDGGRPDNCSRTQLTVTIPADGFVSVNLAPNQGATPAGEYYTAVYYMSDGSTSTQYWVVPAAAKATLAQVRAQVMPAAQAVQTVSKAYVDQAIAELTAKLAHGVRWNVDAGRFI